MAETSQMGSSSLQRFSYFFMALVFILVMELRLAVPLLATLFTFLTLTRLHFVRRGGKWLAVGVFLALVAALAYGLGYFIDQTVRALPEIADKSIPSIIETAKHYGIE